MLKAVIFDFGQTLVDSAAGFKAAEKRAQKAIFTDLQSRASLVSMASFMDVYRHIRKKFHRQSIFSRQRIWQDVYDRYGCEPAEGSLEAWETAYWETVEENTKIFPETLTALSSLSLRYSVALITNTQGQTTSQKHRLRRFPGMAQLFQAVIVAGESGIPPKPDATPFHLCLKQLGIGPEEAVYVGDDWRIDICGARDAGLHAVWLKHHSVQRNWPDVQTDLPVISGLDQLPGLLATIFP